MHTNDVYKLNPFLRIRFGTPISCDLFLSGKSVALSSPRYVDLLVQVRSAMPRAALLSLASECMGVDADQAERIVVGLVEHEVLVPDERSFPELAAVEHWVKRGWLNALMLHMRTCQLELSKAEPGAPEQEQDRVLRTFIEAEGMPTVWKHFDGSKALTLPEPGGDPLSEQLEAVLLARRSNEPWKVGRMSLAQLSNILWYANAEGRRLRLQAEQRVEKHPSALLNSSFSALETYFCAFAVDGLAPGLYHYDMRGHRAVLRKEGDFRELVKRCAIGQERAGSGACAFFISALWGRYMFRYRHALAYRTLLVNVSELGQKYLLLATACGLSTFLTPNFENLIADDLLDVNGYEEAATYLVAAG